MFHFLFGDDDFEEMEEAEEEKRGRDPWGESFGVAELHSSLDGLAAASASGRTFVYIKPMIEEG